MTTLLAELAVPLDHGDGAGPDLRYDPVFDEMLEALREDDTAAQGAWTRPRKRADLARVVQLASETLRTRSRDLRIAGLLVEGLVRTHGFAGLRDGLVLLEHLLDAHWDTVHPRVDDGDLGARAAPLERIGAYPPFAVHLGTIPLTAQGHGLFAYRASREVPLEKDTEGQPALAKSRERMLADGKLAPETFDAALRATPRAWMEQLARDLADAKSALERLRARSEERFAGMRDAPGFSDLARAMDDVDALVQRFVERKREEEPDPPPTVEVTLPDAGTASATSVATDAITLAALGDAAALPADGRAALHAVAAAHALRAANAHDPVPYLVLRAIRWGELHGRDGFAASRLEPPSGAVRTRLKQLALSQEWGTLLEESERAMATPAGRGWLDLQRYTVTACAHLGTGAARVAHAVQSATRALLSEYPLLLDATLLDDTPCASTETREWLTARVGSGDPRPSSEGDVAAAVYDTALREARLGRTARAIALLSADIEGATSLRERFLRRTRLATVLIDAGQPAVALPLLQQLVRQIEQQQLETWEHPSVIAAPIALLHRALTQLDQDAALRTQLHERLCLLDPARAIDLAGSAAT
ncbi:MAG: type VI secretion system protein TssA [Gemmatimonadaceae bacterium]|nr:type VI secretion system protein TssA [Gemmatimonadaceae bacterium]